MFKSAKLKHENTPNLIINFTISIYLGWISVASLANISVMQTHYGLDAFYFSADIWTMMKITIASILAIFFLTKFNDLVYSAVVIWAAFGISQNHDNQSAIYALAIMSMLIVSAFWVMCLTRKAVHRIQNH